MSFPRIALFLPSLEGGGAERVFVELANEFAALGLRVDLVLASAHGPYLAEVSGTVRIIDLHADGVLRALPRLTRYLRSRRPDAMLSGLNHANVVAVLARLAAFGKTRCIVSMRSVPTAVYGANRSIRAWVVLQLMRWSFRFADAIVVNSNAVLSDLSRLSNAQRPEPIVIYNPLNVARIERLSLEEIAHPWCAVGRPPIVLGVGSLTLLKDFPTLIRAFATVRGHRDCRLVILGEGPQREKIESLVRELAIQNDVHVPGFVTNPFAWMKRARVFVSSSRTEGCPNALMQALACGTPVISTDCVGGSAEILQQGKWGRLTPVGDHTAMAIAIEASLDGSIYPDSRQRAEDFSHRKIAREYISVLLPDQSQFGIGC